MAQTASTASGVETAGEDREPDEQPLLVRREQVVRPRHHVLQVPVSRVVVARAGVEQAESPVETLDHRFGPECPRPHGRQLDRQWKTVEAPAQPSENWQQLRRDGEIGASRRCSFAEQLHRRRCRQIDGANVVRDREWCDRVHHLTGHAEWLPRGGHHAEVRAGDRQLGDQ